MKLWIKVQIGWNLLLMKQQEQTNETIKLLKEAVDANTKMSKNVGNNNNNTISINLFLQEKCQNAMNLTDFIDQLHVSLDDLDYSKDNGFVMGMANILTKKLKDLKPTERPIHCSDKKRLQFYVKDDNKWGKDKNNEKIDKTIKTIKRKQTIKLTEWEKMHPNFRNNPIELKEWQQLLCGMTEDPSEQQPEKIKIALDHLPLVPQMVIVLSCSLLKFIFSCWKMITQILNINIY